MNRFLDLTKLSDSVVLSNLERHIKSERKIMHIVLAHIAEVERRKLFLKAGFSSLYKFLTQFHGYAEDAAYDRIAAARVVSSVPEVLEKLEDGSMNLSKLVKVSKCIKQEREDGNTINLEKTEDILSKVENKTLFETEKILACELSHTPKAHQKIKPQADDSVRVELTLSKEQFEIIQEAMNLNSHIVIDGDLAKLFTLLAKKNVQAKKGKENAESSMTQNPTQSFRKKPEKCRKYISVKIKREVFKKANYCCEYVHSETGRRCCSKYQLQPDHIIPLAKGGTDDIENLRALCGVHNRSEADRWGLHRPTH